eukprot:scaffold94557_cov61-Phaeocystis_antarctica.AAC.3
MGVFRAAVLLGIYCVCGPGASRCVLYPPLRRLSISASVVLHFKLTFFISIVCGYTRPGCPRPLAHAACPARPRHGRRWEGLGR